jgi:hypothetical protein
MTQEQINTLYNLTILIHEHEWFGKREKPRDREEVQEWVSKKLASCMDIYTTPCGMSWGVLTTKEEFEKYWNEHSKIKD